MRSALKGLAGIRGAPPPVVALTVAASAAAAIFGVVQGWPLWGAVAVGVVPWLPLLTLEMAWTYRHYHWLALFYVLVITQGGHVLEHVVQMIQLHLLDLAPPEARGVFGALDIEWVHVVWNTFVLVAVIALLFHFSSNPWLWVTAVFAVWHQTEHVYIMSVYLRTDVPGTAGLLAEGGVIGGGLPIVRPDLHFLYNAIETTPLVVAFVYQVRRSYDAWLARAFPRLGERQLVQATERARPRLARAGETIVRQGDFPDGFFIVVRGEAEVVQEDGGAQIAVLGPGQCFGEVGLLTNHVRRATVRARTPVELLFVDRSSFQDLLAASPETAEDYLRLAEERM